MSPLVAVPTAVSGAAGRMGRLLLAGILPHERLKLVAASDSPTHPDQGMDAGQLSGKWSTGVHLGVLGPGAFADAKVVIDFSLASATDGLLDQLDGRALVIGTTGLSAGTRQRIRDYARSHPVVMATNFSTGVNLLLGLASKAAAVLPDYHVEIVEMHHSRKHDAPSGTALSLGEAMATARGQTLDALATHGREGATGPRDDQQIGLHALRGGDVFGEHTVYLAGPGERLQLGHLATSRDAFASGALRAAAWVVDQEPGLYDMRDVLGMG